MNRVMATAFGLVMVAAAAVQADGAALVCAGVAGVAVLAGNLFRPAATLAVLAVAAALAIDDASALLSATAGLCAAGYLVLRHTAVVTAPTIIGAVSFSAVALAAVSVPIELPWAPLLAPVAVLTVVVFATRPFWAKR